MGLIVYEAIHLQVRQSRIIYLNVFWSISPLFSHCHLARSLPPAQQRERRGQNVCGEMQRKRAWMSESPPASGLLQRDPRTSTNRKFLRSLIVMTALPPARLPSLFSVMAPYGGRFVLWIQGLILCERQHSCLCSCGLHEPPQLAYRGLASSFSIHGLDVFLGFVQ